MWGAEVVLASGFDLMLQVELKKPNLALPGGVILLALTVCRTPFGPFAKVIMRVITG
jgi:hypothetical protein